MVTAHSGAPFGTSPSTFTEGPSFAHCIRYVASNRVREVFLITSLLATPGCSLFVPKMQAVTITSTDPAGKIFVDDEPVGTGKIATKLDRTKTHTVIVRLLNGRAAECAISQDFRHRCARPCRWLLIPGAIRRRLWAGLLGARPRQRCRERPGQLGNGVRRRKTRRTRWIRSRESILGQPPAWVG